MLGNGLHNFLAYEFGFGRFKVMSGTSKPIGITPVRGQISGHVGMVGLLNHPQLVADLRLQHPLLRLTVELGGTQSKVHGLFSLARNNTCKIRH